MSYDVSAQDTYSDLQAERDMLKKLIKSLQKYNRKLADAEQKYRMSFSKECIRIKLDGVEGENGKTDPVAWTMTPQIARGLPEVAGLRYERDLLEGEKEAIMQKIYQTKIEIDLLQKEMEAIQKGE
ncbi:MAG: hypothetical protein K9K32_06770 [Halanaerobiales bacterium]|nr:hypothetical protein [Halanaerobiales bacterium]